MTPDETIARKIREIRERQEIEIADIAKAARVSASTWRKYESGSFRIGDRVQEKIAKALGVKSLDLVPTLGDNIRSAREEAGMSKAEAAAEAGMAWNVWHFYETDQREPSAGKIITIARALGTTGSRLLGA